MVDFGITWTLCTARLGNLAHRGMQLPIIFIIHHISQQSDDGVLLCS